MPLFLSLILVISAFVRGFGLNISPPELFGDEIDAGYQAYSLLKTGQDIYGQTLPTYIHSLSEWRAPLFIYTTVPSIAVFGNTQLGVRLPEVIFGSLAPIILFFLVFELSRSKSQALLSAVALSLMPWHILYSRAAFEVALLLDLLMLGSIYYLQKKFATSLLFFALTIYTYSTAIAFTPLLLLVLLIKTKKFPSLIAIVASLLILAPFATSLFSGRAQARFGLLSIFSDTQLVDTINRLRDTDTKFTAYIFHNRPETYFTAYFSRYLQAFSTNFLFVSGDPSLRQSIQIIGGLFPITAPLLALGLYYLARRRQWFWLVWLALSPIPAAATVDGGFHATRLILMVPPLAVALGSGFVQFWQSVSNIKMRFIISGLFLIAFSYQFLSVAHYYLYHYPAISWRWWQVGFKSAIQKANQLSSGYDKIVYNNSYEPSLPRFLFYSSYSPSEFHKLFRIDQPTNNILPNFDGFSFDNIHYFGTFSSPARDNGIARLLNPKNLYIISQRDDVGGDWDWRVSPPSEVKVLYTSTTLSNQPVFYLVTAK
jgi:4-amino-4-deoxy-L-arabinose transferase-like glycosyltransferase